MTKPPLDLDGLFLKAAMEAIGAYGDDAPEMVQGVIKGCRERGDEQGAVVWEWVLVRLGGLRKPPAANA
jgi:hypothetical protein